MTTIRVGRRSIDLSNQDKPFFPDDGVTKGDVVEYYRRIAAAMLPHLRDRALVFQRFPDGIAKQGFYGKNTPDYFPDWIERFSVKKKGGSLDHVVCNEAATLVYLANQGAITFHVWSSKTKAIRDSDRLIIDLDPPEGEFDVAVETAFATRDLLDDLGLVPFVKTTGGKGLHVVAPLSGSFSFEEVRAFGDDIATVLAARRPDALTNEVRKNKRNGRLFLDVGRNAYAQHSVAPYSLRPYEGAPVSTPVTWEELSDGVDPRSFTIESIPKRLEETDPWSGMARRTRSLARPRKALDKLLAEEA